MTFLVAIVVLVGLVWGTIFALRGSVLAGCLAVLGVTYCLGHFFLSFDLGPFPLTLDRLAVAGLAGAFVVQWRLQQIELKRLTGSDWLLIAFLAILVVSTFTHDWRISTPGTISPLWILVAAYIIPAVLYFVARHATLTAENSRWIYAAMTGFGVYLAVTALAEILQLWWLVYPSYISDPKLGIHYGRARGPMLQSQSLGFYLGIGLMACWAWQRRTGRNHRAIALSLLPMFLAALYFTYTRCAWLGAGLGGLIVMCLTLPRNWRNVVLAGAVVGGLGITLFGLDDLIEIERDAGSAAARDSVTQRASFTYVSWKMFLDHPLWGVGFGQFPDAKRPYLSDRTVPLYLEAIREQPHHNTPLAVLTETGLIGLVTYLCLFGSWARTGWRLWRDTDRPDFIRTQGLLMLAALGVYTGPALFFDLGYSPQDHCLLFFLAGLTAAAASCSAGAVAGDRRSSERAVAATYAQARPDWAPGT